MPDRRQGPGSESDHRSGREDGFIVYPVYSRRSGGVSVGINLFPDRKLCSFDCPYCEVFPFETPRRFSLPAMERELRESLAELRSRGLQVRDLCFSGNGEPTMSPDFTAALDAAARIRDELVPASSLVVITNGSTLADSALAAALADAAASRAAGGFGLDIWLKVDAGTEAWYRRIDRGALPYDALVAALTAFVAAVPVTVQTMLCAVGGAGPDQAEAVAWIDLVVGLAISGDRHAGGVRRVHLYGKARPAPADPAAAALPLAALEERAAALRAAFQDAGLDPAPPVEVFE